MSESAVHPRAAAGLLRAQSYRGAGIHSQSTVRDVSGIPLGLSRSVPFGSQMRSEVVTKGDRKFYRVEGYASVYDVGYEMWDFFGPYTEFVDRGAADETLAGSPDVVFLVNHKGLSMARTKSKTLELGSDSTGLSDVAWLNPERTDVKDLILAIDDGTVTEQSFAFMITEGWWSQDFTEFRIKSFNIDRGDVSAVNYGASPTTSIAARQRDIFAELDLMPAYAARAAIERLTARKDVGIYVPSADDPVIELGTKEADEWIAKRYGSVSNVESTREASPVERQDESHERGRSLTQIEARLLHLDD